GTGKSTLLEAMAIKSGFNPEGGTINYSFSTYDDHSHLYEGLTITKDGPKPSFGYFLRAESFYNLATKEEEYSRGPNGKPQYLHQQSHGESFLNFILNYNGQGLYFLDEPEAALSPQRQLSLLLHISEMAKQGSQFFIATHSPILLGTPDAEILSFSNEGIIKCRYEDTESYQITSMFINDRERLLKYLFESKED
ncbi:MAG: AAA family ATPase, partial [Erysipelotrichaceae bacterium]|nr:AAA family ATPase [Erysipelotrichaceae bacterium]